jgi:hypothetical protein
MRAVFTMPMIWLDGSSGKFWLVGGVLIALVIIFAQLGRSTEQGHIRRWWSHPGWFVLWLTIGLFFFRLPTITTAYTFIEDESTFIAGAITLTYDPVFWRTVHCTTSGPLNYYILLLPRLIGLPLDFLSARLVGASLLLAMCLIHYASARRLGNETVARLVSLPIWAMAAFASGPGLVNYHSEMVSMFLLQVATFALVIWWQASHPGWKAVTWLALAGFSLGWLPWAKLQAVPAGLGVAALVLVANFWKWWAIDRRACLCQGLILILAGLMPTSFVFGVTYLNGIWDGVWISYLQWNFQLAGIRGSRFSIWDRCKDLVQALLTVANVREFFLWWLGTGLFAVLILSGKRWRGFWSKVSFPVLLSLVQIVLLAYAIILSGTVLHVSFHHYMLFLLFPLALLQTCLLVWAFQDASGSPVNPSRKTGKGALFILGCLVILATLHMAKSGWEGLEPYLHKEDYYEENHSSDPLARNIFLFSQPDDAILVWGCAARYHAITQRRQATGLAVTEFEVGFFEKGYFVNTFLALFDKNRPAVFIDEVGETSLCFRNRQTFGHEVFPELARRIQADYVLVQNLREGRIYVRKDMLPG